MEDVNYGRRRVTLEEFQKMEFSHLDFRYSISIRGLNRTEDVKNFVWVQRIY